MVILQQLMKYLFATVLTILSLVLVPALSSITNTSDFYNKQIGYELFYTSFSGFEDVDWFYPKQSAKIYYSLWEGFFKEFQNKEVPLIIWLQGGPGAPSQFGCFNEVGTIFIQGNKDSYKATQNPWAWNYFGHLMCVDQPVGVGFSYNNNTQKVNNTRDAAKQFVNFLSNFYKNNKDLDLIKNPLYLAGQSYAGHYIPAIAELILMNKTLGFNLQGIMIGDGFVDPINQINNYDSFLNSVGVVSNEWRETTAFMQKEATQRIMRSDFKEASGYVNFIIANDQVVNKYYAGMSLYNYKQYDNGNINPDYSVFLTKNKNVLGVPNWLNYVDDNQQMYEDFAEDISISYKRSLQIVLNLNLKTLIYNGQNDFIVPTVGVLAYMNTLEWKYSKQFTNSPKKIWSQVAGQILGWYKTKRNLSFVLVRNAGHLLPADQPRAAWFMMRRFFQTDW